MNYFSNWFLCSLSATALWVGIAWAGENEGLLRQASVYVEAERYKDAVGLLKQVDSQSRDEELSVRILTGKIYLAIDRPAKALEYFEDAESQSLDNFDAAIGAAQASLRLGKFKQARRFVQSAQKLNQDSSEPDFILAVISLRNGNPAEANGRMLDLLKQRPESEGVVIAYSKYLVLTGDNSGAKRIVERFLERSNNAAAVRDYLADLEFKSGNQIAGLQLKRMAAELYEKQGSKFKRDAAYAWLEVNGGGAAPSPLPVLPSFPAPEPVFPRAIETDSSNSDKAVIAQKLSRPKIPAAAATDKDFAFPIKRFPFPAGVMITGGSGFIIDGGSKIVTNRHVVEGGKEFAVRTGLGEIIRAKLLFLSPSDDLAVLSLDTPVTADRSIPSNGYAKPGVGRNVVVMGYPLWSVLGEGAPSLTNGMVSKRTGLQDDKGTFQLTAKVNKGNSGGPVFDLNGRVVGITVGKLDTKKFQDDQGFTPEDVNFAIHVDRLPPVANVQLDDQGAIGPELGTEELYQAMLGKVVMVATYK